MNRLTIFLDFFGYVKKRKKWWLAPIILILLLMSGLIVLLAQHAWVAPVIYPLF